MDNSISEHFITVIKQFFERHKLTKLIQEETDNSNPMGPTQNQKPLLYKILC